MVGDTSPSVATTVPTVVPLAVFSARLNAWPAVTTGTTSFTSVRLIVTVSAALVFTPSETVIWSVKLLAASRSS